MTRFEFFDRRPSVFAVAGPNGAGKSTFYRAHIAPAGLPFVNADVLGAELGLDAAGAMQTANALRRSLVTRGASFVFETVFSDPVGDKLTFLAETAARGYTVVLCFIGLPSADLSEERVAMRVLQGGHDVPRDRLKARFPRTLANLHAAIRQLPHVLVFDNSDLARPFRLVAAFEQARRAARAEPIPEWLKL